MNNRLKLMRVYLVGPMDHDRESGKAWRIEMSEWLKSRGALPVDPYDKPLLPIHKEGLEDDDQWVKRKELMSQLADNDTPELRAAIREIMKPIVHTDMRIVDNVDCLIVHLDVDKRPCGTFDEMFTGADQNKPVIVHCPQGIDHIHDWNWGRLKPELFFDSWADVKEYLRHIDEDDEINLLDKWKFFEWEPLVREVLCQN